MDRMRSRIFWSLFLLTTIHTISAVDYFISSPNVFRIDVPETVAITITNHKDPIEVEVAVKDYPNNVRVLDFQRVVVNSGSPVITKLTVKTDLIPKQQKDEEVIFVNLVIKATQGQFAEKSIMVPVRKFSGYAFIQTDKPIYIPRDTVKIRVLHLTEELLPNGKQYILEIKNPKGDRVLYERHTPEKNGISEHVFQFPALPLLGNWSVAVLYGYKENAKKTLNFEVKKYVLPTFSVKIEAPQFILNNERHIKHRVVAKYVYGKPVEGILNIKYGIKSPDGNLIPVLGWQMININGEKFLSIDVENEIKKRGVVWFPEVANCHLYIDAEVIETATGNKEIAIDESSIFTYSPYTISFSRSPRDFKPGVPYHLRVDVKLTTGQEAPKVPVHVLKAVATKNGRIVRNLPIPLDLATNDLGRAVFEFNTGANDEQLELTVTTKDEAWEENQVKATMTVMKYHSPVGNSYVWIASPPSDMIFKVGNPFQTTVTVHPAQKNIKLYYMVVSRGIVLLAKETEPQTDAFVYSIQFVVTPEMSPGARLLVYIVINNHIIADSMKIDVEQKCKYNNGNGLKLSVNAPLYKPGQKVKLKIEGEIDSHVGVLAVDEAVYLLNKEGLLTRERVYKEMMSHDLGCGPGGGTNTENIFRNTGLLILSNYKIGNHVNTIGNCLQYSRKKRAIEPIYDMQNETDILTMKKMKVSEYSGVAATCCQIGQMDGPPGMDCTERAAKIFKAIGDKENCSQAFLDCCQTQIEYKAAINSLARTILKNDGFSSHFNVEELIESFEAETLRNYRWIFTEVWIHSTHKIGSHPCKGSKKDSCELEINSPHSITTWRIQAFGISTKTGMCVAEPIQVPVMKNMFIQMQLPYSAVRGEQILVPITVFNYGDDPIEAIVYIMGMEGVCTGVGPGERSDKLKVVVPSNGAKTVTFPVMPLEVATYPIKAVALSSDGSDSVEKTLYVIPEGVPTEKTINLILDPNGSMRKRRRRTVLDSNVEERYDEKNNLQYITVALDLPKEHIPGTEQCLVYTMGDLMTQSITTTLQGLEGRFFKKPSGCGEQTMITFAPLVYTISYLKRTGRLTADNEKNGYALMQQGYAHQMTYRKADGSFAVWTTSPSGTWLTAFVAKSFCQANAFINIPKNVRCGAVDWLLTRQRDTGMFYDPQGIIIHHREMIGGIQSDTTLTAFVLIAMLECDQCISANKRISVLRAVSFLEQHIDFLEEPYALSVVTYALTLADSKKKTVANDKLKSKAIYNEATDTRFWNWSPTEYGGGPKPWVYQQNPSALAVETTSYALLTQLILDDITHCHPIANWINQQRNAGGSFVSTQDSVMALQALSEYAFKASFPALDLHCNMTSSLKGRGKYNLHLQKDDANILHQQEVPAGGKLHVDVAGKGVASMAIALHYNKEEDKKQKCKFYLKVKTVESDDVVLPALPKPELEDFDEIPEIVIKEIVSVQEQKSKFGYDVQDVRKKKDKDRMASKEKQHQSQHVVKLEICAKYLSERSSGMSILEVGLFTGYKIFVEELNELVDNEEISVTQYEISDRSVVLYLDTVPHDKEICLNVRTYQEVKVGKVQPARVKIYDYYEPGKSCEKFYSPDGASPMLSAICEGSQCRCVEGQCPPCHPFEEIKNARSDEERRKKLLRMACSKHDFVWNGTLHEKKQDGSFTLYTYLVESVIKAGVQKRDELQSEYVTFTGRQICECPKMEVGKSYIIMGRDGFRYPTENGDWNYKYVFDQKTSVHKNSLLRELKDIERNLEKNFLWLYKRMVINEMTCDQ